MQTVRFDAWVNGTDFSSDPGHLIMFDEDGGYYYELAMGPLITDEKHPYFGHKENYLDVRDQTLKPATTRHIELKKNRREAYYREQLMKMRPKSTTLRFTHLFYIKVEISDKEYTNLMAITITRGLCGAYNFCGEAQEKDMLLARCVSSLEFLARMRDVQLRPGTALELITEFSSRFNCPVIREHL